MASCGEIAGSCVPRRPGRAGLAPLPLDRCRTGCAGRSAPALPRAWRRATKSCSSVPESSRSSSLTRRAAGRSSRCASPARESCRGRCGPLRHPGDRPQRGHGRQGRDFDPIVDSNPEMQRFFWRLIQRNEAIGYEWLVNCGRRDSTARVAHLLCETAVRMHSEESRPLPTRSRSSRSPTLPGRRRSTSTACSPTWSGKALSGVKAAKSILPTGRK